MDAGNQTIGSKLVLYSYWQSSCSWRVRFALNLKGLPYEYRAVNLSKGEQFCAEFERLNPLHFVPVLVDGDVVVSESFAILLIASIVGSSIQPLHMQSVLKDLAENVGMQESLSWAQSNIEKGFQALEKLLNKYAFRYSTGEEIYMADVFLAPQIAVAAARFHIDMGKFPSLSRVYESYQALPEFQASSPEKQPDVVA